MGMTWKNNVKDNEFKPDLVKLAEKNDMKKVRIGLFNILCLIVLVAALIFTNLTFVELPSKYTEIDISGKGIYTLDPQTVEIAKGVDNDIDIYWIVQSGNENKEIEVLLNRYADLSEHINVHKTDPIVDPNLVNLYTSEPVNDNSLIIAGNNRSRYIDYNEIFAYNYNYFSDEGVTTGFNGESLITSAIEYINSGDMPKIYKITGHDEITLSTEFEEKINKNNFILEDLNLTGKQHMPEDADCLLVAGPKKDYTVEECGIIEEYLNEGGKLLVYTDYGYTDFPNLMNILEQYGVKASDGLVLEQDTSMYYADYPMQIMPDVKYHDITSSVIKSGLTVLVPVAHGLKIDPEAESSGVVVSLLDTSSDAYAKTGNTEGILRSENDESGPFSLGAVINPGTENNNAQIVWFTTSELLNKEYDGLVNGADTQLAITSLSWLTDKESTVVIPSKIISTANIVVPGGYAARTGVILICVIPMLYLALGAVITIKRKRR